VAFVALFHQSQGFGHVNEGVVCSPCFAVCRSQPGKIVRAIELSPAARHCSQGVAHLSDSFIGPSLLDQRRAPTEGSQKQEVSEPLLSTDGNRRFGVLR
jgi:hypothetical protein